MSTPRDDASRSGEIIWTYSAGTVLEHNSRELIPSPATDVDSVPASDIVADDSAANVVVIEKRALVRECLTRCLKLVSGHNVISFPTVDSWLEVADSLSVSLIVLCTANKPKDPETHREISLLSQSSNRLPTILLSDVEDPDQIVDALDKGARGYIPTSVSLDVAIEAMRLVRAGGVFVPASSLIAARRSANSSITSKQVGHGLFTARQAAVVEALRRGKANKIIAYELNMRESTVKVHVRNIMKKLRAKNRTEVAFMTNGMMQPDGD
jgi:DNA-binding NarL/FixJ family response regulator